MIIRLNSGFKEGYLVYDASAEFNCFSITQKIQDATEFDNQTVKLLISFKDYMIDDYYEQRVELNVITTREVIDTYEEVLNELKEQVDACQCKITMLKARGEKND